MIDKLARGIAALFKLKGGSSKVADKVTNAFSKNLVDEFGKAEVKESLTIVKDAYSKNRFYPGAMSGTSAEDDLVNLLEARYMGSNRLQAHPLSFDKRGTGAANRYKVDKSVIEKQGYKRFTDMPEGPGDVKLYKNRWGEMSKTMIEKGNPVYKKPPGIFDELPEIFAGKKTLTPNQRALSELTGKKDSSGIKSILSEMPEASPGMQRIIDKRVGEGIMAPTAANLEKAIFSTKQMKGAASSIQDMSGRMEMFAQKGDFAKAELLKDALEKYRVQIQGLKPGDDFPMLIDPTRALNAKGGRIEMMSGGILKGLAGLLRPKAAAAAREVSQMRPKLQMGQKPAQIGDMEQIKNIIRDPRTDLERILKERVDGTKATPIDTVTIRELEQMFLDSPRYTDKEKLVLFKFMDKEKIRANHFHNTGEELPDDMLEMLYRSGEGDFNQGGRVGMFRGGMGRRAKDRQKEGITGSIGGLGGMSTPAPGTGAKGPAGGQTMNPNKAGVNLNERPDNIDIGQIDKLSSNFNIKDLVKDYSSLNNNFSPNIYTGAINPIYSGYVNEEEPSIIDTLNRYNIFRGNIGNFEYDIDPLKQELDASYSFNQGGRVGMFMGGIPAALKGAAMLAKRGMKPFGQKQTYRQNVKTTGMDELQKGMKQEFDKELYLIDKGRRGGNPEAELFDLYEDIASGKRYSMLPEATRSKMITKIEDSMKAMDVDGGDYQNFRTYLNEEYGFPNETAFDAIRKGVDKGQIKTMKAEDLLDKLDKASGKNVIPFKKPKKAEGGRVNYATGSIVDQLFPDTTPKMQTTQKEALTSAQEVFESLYPSADNAMFYTSALMGTKPKSSRYKRTLKNLLNAITVADGGLIPPQKGPMSDGMGSLFRRK